MLILLLYFTFSDMVWLSAIRESVVAILKAKDFQTRRRHQGRVLATVGWIRSLEALHDEDACKHRIK